MNNTATIKITIFLTIILIGALAVSLFFYFQLKSNLNEVEVIAVRVAEARNINEVALKDDLINSEQELKKLHSYFLTKEEIVSFIDSIERLAGDSGNEYELTSIDEKADGENKLKVSIEVVGSWEATQRFLSRVENYPKIVSVESAKLDLVSGDWTMSIDINALIKAENQNGGE